METENVGRINTKTRLQVLSGARFEHVGRWERGWYYSLFSMLKDQLPALNEPETNPLVGIEGSRDEEEPPPFMIAGEDEDDDIDIEL